MNIEDEKYIKCSDCNNAVGCFLNEEDKLFIYCGNCKDKKQFVKITKEEFDAIQYLTDNES